MAPKDPELSDHDDEENLRASDEEADDEAEEETGAGDNPSSELSTEVSQGRGAWEGSYIIQADIDSLYKSRKIPPGVEARVPPASDYFPQPEEGEYVVFLAHFQRGFALPLS